MKISATSIGDRVLLSLLCLLLNFTINKNAIFQYRKITKLGRSEFCPPTLSQELLF